MQECRSPRSVSKQLKQGKSEPTRAGCQQTPLTLTAARKVSQRLPTSPPSIWTPSIPTQPPGGRHPTSPTNLHSTIRRRIADPQKRILTLLSTVLSKRLLTSLEARVVLTPPSSLQWNMQLAPLIPPPSQTRQLPRWLVPSTRTTRSLLRTSPQMIGKRK